MNGNTQMTVEEIQDSVEMELMKSARKDVAQKYIAYRNQRSMARKAKTRDVFLEIINIKNNDVTRENANMNADTPAGMMMKFASETTKPFVDDYLLSEEAREAVKNNYLHIHDKDYYPTKSLTCVQHPLDNILKHGFQAGHGESRPAKRIETASVLACISMETAQNEMHGGQAIPAFDFYLAPFVRSSFVEEVKNLESLTGKDYSHLYDVELKDYEIKPLDNLQGEERLLQHAINKTVGRVHQAMEAFIHNMNTIHSRGGNQVVFSSINYGTDTSAEGRCIMREILKSTYEGVGNGETAIFPIQIWKKKRGVNYLPEDRNYDLYQLACKVTARRFFPNFLNLDASYNQDPEWRADDPKRYIHEVATMGCRTRVFENRFGPKTSIGRGNLSFTTINIVKLAIECMGIEDKEQRINSVLRQARQPAGDHREAAARPLRVPEDGLRQAVPPADAQPVDWLREAEAHRHHRERHQPGHAGHRLHRSGRVSGGPHRQAPWRERGGSGAGTEDCDLHARPHQRVQRALPAQLLRAGHAGRGTGRQVHQGGPQGVRRHSRRHRPRLLHQLQPRARLLQVLGTPQGRGGGSLSQPDARRSHLLRGD